MGDSWEDWDEDEVVLPSVNGAAAPVDAKKFDDEDQEEEQPKWKDAVPKPKEKKRIESKYDESRGVHAIDEGPLDDPIAEKLRQQRLVEEADYAATMELFGKQKDLDTFIPKSKTDFEELGQVIAAKYLIPHSKGNSAHYKAALKSLMHAALKPLSAPEVKDIETCVAGVRADKLKEEKAMNAGKKTVKKAALNVGKSGGSAGLDDYVYDDPLDDDYDFM